MNIKEIANEHLIIEDPKLREIDTAQLRKCWIDFFYSSEKSDFARQPGQLSGYFQYGMERAINAPRADPKEFFHFYQDTPCPNELRKETLHLFSILKSLALNTVKMTLLQRGVHQIPPDSIENSLNNVLRISYYPFDPEPETLAWDHTDINFVTVIPEASAIGLQVMREPMGWIACNPKPGQAVILFGDMMADWSNGIIPATKHRVVNPLSERISFNFFTNPVSDLRLSSRWTASEFLNHRMEEIGLNQ